VDAEEAEEDENELYQRLSLESEFSSSAAAAAAAGSMQEAAAGSSSRRLRQGASANVLLASLFHGGSKAASVPAGNELQLLHALVSEQDMLEGTISVLD
jgi:hypothetical protein